jgi:hypothetical protein
MVSPIYLSVCKTTRFCSRFKIKIYVFFLKFKEDLAAMVDMEVMAEVILIGNRDFRKIRRTHKRSSAKEHKKKPNNY